MMPECRVIRGRRGRPRAARLAALAGAMLLAAAAGALGAAGDAPAAAAAHELDRVQALLRLRLANLPPGSGVLILRDDAAGRCTLRVPSRLLFEPDSATLRHDAGAIAPLAAAEQVLRRDRRLRAEIIVFTDSLGGVEANQILSDRRAEAVYEALTARGIDPQRLAQHGAGEATMVAPNDTPQGRMENRRVEIAFGPELGGGDS